jgi:hypothetical protein
MRLINHYIHLFMNYFYHRYHSEIGDDGFFLPSPMELYEGIPLSDDIYYAPQMVGMRLGWFMIGFMTLIQYDVL